MKIAIIRQRYVAYGGAENVVSQFVEELVRQGHTVHVFANRWKVKDEEPKGVVFHHVPLLAWGSFLKLISFALFCRLQVRKGSFDVVHSFERTLRQDIYRAGDGCHREWLHQRQKRLSPFKKILILLNPFHWATLFIERRIFTGGRTKKIIANSNRGKEEIIRRYGTSPSKIEVIYNGVDLNRFHPSNREKYRNKIRSQFRIDEKELVVLFVGSGFERKGLQFLIEAGGALKNRYHLSSFHILVVGRGKTNRYHRLARRAGIGDRVRFLGTYGKVEEVYAAADVLVLPTLYDPFANVCLEAMAAGIPVISTRINGASEVMDGKLSAFILEDPADTIKLAEMIFQLNDPGRRAELGRLSRSVAERYPENIQFEKILSLYE